MHANRITDYLRTIITHSVKLFKLDCGIEVFFHEPCFPTTQRYEQQIYNELRPHLQIVKQDLGFALEIESVIHGLLTQELKKSERLFIERFKKQIKQYLCASNGGVTDGNFLFVLWASWFLEFCVNNYVVQNNPKLTKEYATHEVLNTIEARFYAFCLFFDEFFTLAKSEEKTLRRLILKTLQHLVRGGFIRKRLTYEFSREMKSIIMYEFPIKYQVKITLHTLKVNLISLKIVSNKNNIFSRGLTYLNVNKIMLVNEASSKHFNLNDYGVLYKLFKTSYVLDVEFYWTLEPLIRKETPAILWEEGLDTADIGKTSPLSSYWYNLIYLKLKDELRWFEGGIYWNYLFDFRGRLYVDSVISYQSAKIFRHLYLYSHQASPTNNKSLIKNLDDYIQLLGANNDFKTMYPNIDIEGCKKEVFWLIIELAKIFKNDHLSQQKYSLTIEELFDIGVKNLRVDLGALTLEKRIEYLFIHSVFGRLNARKLLNFIIFKDSTASALQLLSLVLGVNDEEHIKIFNLNSTTAWYDPYTYIIRLFLETHALEPTYLKYFKREHLKKTIMTYNYSATLYTCMQNFYDEVQIKSLTSEERRKITEYFVDFYKFLEGLFSKGVFFKTSINEINKRLLAIFQKENALTISLNDASTAALHYYKKKESRINLTDAGGMRATTLLWETTQIPDWKKTSNALKPNMIHALDAALVRLTIYTSTYVVATIHDSFGASLYDIEGLVQLINSNLNLVYYKTHDLDWYTNKNYYSIFIIF